MTKCTRVAAGARCLATLALLPWATSVGCTDEDTLDEDGDAHCEPAPGQADVTQPIGRVALLSPGADNHCAVLEDGSMRCWGDNIYGQLGNGTLEGGRYPAQVNGVPAILRAALGSGHMCVVTRNQCVWCWGDNLHGQLGTGEGSLTPVRVPGVTRAADLSATGLSNVVARDTAEVIWWGQRNPGVSSERPKLWVFGAYAAIAAGYKFACGLREDGRVDCWGDNEYGQLGAGDFVDRTQPNVVVGLTDVIQLSVGGGASCAVRSDKTLWCWGYNGYRQIGDGSVEDQPSPRKVPLEGVEEVAVANHVCARLTDGRVLCWGDNYVKQVGNGANGDPVTKPHEIPGIEGVRALSAASASTCVLKNDHDVFCWGYNKEGALGDGTYTNSSKPVQVVWDPPNP